MIKAHFILLISLLFTGQAFAENIDWDSLSTNQQQVLKRFRANGIKCQNNDNNV